MSFADVVTLQVLYKLKTSKVFDESRCRQRPNDDGDTAADDFENPFAINQMYFCVDSRLLCVAGNSHVIVFTFSKLEMSLECSVSIQLPVCTGISYTGLLFLTEKVQLFQNELVFNEWKNFTCTNAFIRTIIQCSLHVRTSALRLLIGATKYFYQNIVSTNTYSEVILANYDKTPAVDNAHSIS